MREKKSGALSRMQKLRKRLSHSFGRLCKCYIAHSLVKRGWLVQMGGILLFFSFAAGKERGLVIEDFIYRNLHPTIALFVILSWETFITPLGFCGAVDLNRIGTRFISI